MKTVPERRRLVIEHCSRCRRCRPMTWRRLGSVEIALHIEHTGLAAGCPRGRRLARSYRRSMGQTR